VLEATEPITKINVTPIIDVALVLVIILLVTAPMMLVAELPVNLPLAHTRDAEDERNLSVTIAADGTLAVDHERIDRAALTGAIAYRLAQTGNQNLLVVVRADTNTPYANLRDVLDRTRAAGATRVAIATRQQTKERP
jgi:biopolymer transport protein TolR